MRQKRARLGFRSPYRSPYVPSMLKNWSEWQDLSYVLLVIELFEDIRTHPDICVLLMCMRDKRRNALIWIKAHGYRTRRGLHSLLAKDFCHP
jgi:hypothetical protein